MWRSMIPMLFTLAALPSWSTELHQIYFIPLPEDQVQETLKTLASNTGNLITSVTSAVVVGDRTIVIYDQWEDGYESDLGNPTQASTLVWGDGDPSNGDASEEGICTPKKACQGDILRAGATLTLKNDVPIPRDPTQILWDGRDRIGADKITAVTRAAWAVQPGPVLAGALEVYPTEQYDTQFEIPIGENVPLPPQVRIFKLVDLYLMAGDQPTEVTIDPTGTGTDTPIRVSLGPGEGYHTSGVQMGARVSATHPIQAYIISGNPGARYESRWFTLPPLSRWGSRIFTPVGTASPKGALTYVFFYNPRTNDSIEITYETLQGEKGTIQVAPGTTEHFQMPIESGAQFASRNDEVFFALAAVGVNLTRSQNIAHDWGFSLIPERNLTTQAVVAWGPGSDPSRTLKPGNPLWLTAIQDTKVYVDWAGDGAGRFTAPNGEPYDQVVELRRLQSVPIMAPNLDNTAARLFTTNGAVFTAAWGQDPTVPRSRNPYLDMGTTILPIEVCDFSMRRGDRLPRRAISLCCLGMGRHKEVVTKTGQEIVGSVLQVTGPTLVSRGDRYVPVSEGMGLQVKERIMALAKGGAYLLFRNGCGYHLEPNEILTIEEQSPCCLAAMGTTPTHDLIQRAGLGITIGGGIIEIINPGGGGGIDRPLEPISR